MNRRDEGLMVRRTTSWFSSKLGEVDRLMLKQRKLFRGKLAWPQPKLQSCLHPCNHVPTTLPP